MTTLERIRAEIEAVEPKSHVQYGMRWADSTLMIPFHKVMQILDKYAEQEPKGQTWIPVRLGVPKDTEPVNITWVNHNPETYYADIKDKPFTTTGHYCNGKWWWYSVTCQDYLDEYGHSDVDAMDDDIEVVAWMPLPEPYEKGGE